MKLSDADRKSTERALAHWQAVLEETARGLADLPAGPAGDADRAVLERRQRLAGNRVRTLRNQLGRG